MKIHCLTTFLDGPDRFEQGDVRTVNDDRAARFIAAGWAHADGTPAPADVAAQPVSLDIHNATHAQGVTHG